MSNYKKLRWVPFYLLVPLGAALLFLDEDIPMPAAWRGVILFAIAVLICVLAVNWIDRHPRLIESEGLDTPAYRILSYPWSVFQRSSSTTEDAGASEYESARHEEIPIRQAGSPWGD